MNAASIRLNHFYTNNTQSMVRETLEFVTIPDQKDQKGIKYRVVKSHNRRRTPGPYSVGFIGVCALEHFAKWTRMDVTAHWKDKPW